MLNYENNTNSVRLTVYFDAVCNVITTGYLEKDSRIILEVYFYQQNVVKIKSVPLQAWSGPEGSRKLRFPDFMTTTQGGGKVVSLTQRPYLPPGHSPGTHFC